MSQHTSYMPDNLASRKRDFARLTGEGNARGSGIFPRMPKKPPGPLQIAVSGRLKAIQEELGHTDAEMASIAGTNRTTWANWANRENMPEEAGLIRLCDYARVSLEWLYRGRGDYMSVRLFIRLELRLAGIDPDTATPEEKALAAAKAAAAP